MQHQQQMQQVPLSLSRSPWKQLDAEYKELQQDVVHPPVRECPANSWITAKTWKIVDHHAMLHRKGQLSQTSAHSLSWQLKVHLVADHLLHT